MHVVAVPHVRGCMWLQRTEAAGTYSVAVCVVTILWLWMFQTKYSLRINPVLCSDKHTDPGSFYDHSAPDNNNN